MITTFKRQPINNTTDRPAIDPRFSSVVRQLEESASSETAEFPLSAALRLDREASPTWVIVPDAWLMEPLSSKPQSMTLLDLLQALPRHEIVRYTVRGLTWDIITQYNDASAVSSIDALRKVNRKNGLLDTALLLHAVDPKLSGRERKIAADILFKLVGWPADYRNLFDLLLKDIPRSMESFEELPNRESFSNACWVLEKAYEFGLAPTGCGLCPDSGLGLAWGNPLARVDVECYNDGEILCAYGGHDEDSTYVALRHGDEACLARAINGMKACLSGESPDR